MPFVSQNLINLKRKILGWFEMGIHAGVLTSKVFKTISDQCEKREFLPGSVSYSA